jgi:putative transposase
VRRRKRKRIAGIERQEKVMATGPNQSWSMDFVSDGFVDGWRLRCLNIVDDFTKECLAIEVDKSLLGRRVVGVLERLAEMRGGGCQRVSRWITGRSSSAKR